jgi:streptomycin 6-kinase
VIDAKGIYGAIGFELANAFRNPKGTRDAIMDPDRARALAKRSPDALGITPRTQLLWACAKCALSVAWRTDGTLTDYDADIDVLTMLLALVGDA